MILSLDGHKQRVRESDVDVKIFVGVIEDVPTDVFEEDEFWGVVFKDGARPKRVFPASPEEGKAKNLPHCSGDRAGPAGWIVR